MSRTSTTRATSSTRRPTSPRTEQADLTVAGGGGECTRGRRDGGDDPPRAARRGGTGVGRASVPAQRHDPATGSAGRVRDRAPARCGAGRRRPTWSGWRRRRRPRWRRRTARSATAGVDVGAPVGLYDDTSGIGPDESLVGRRRRRGAARRVARGRRRRAAARGPPSGAGAVARALRRRRHRRRGELRRVTRRRTAAEPYAYVGPWQQRGEFWNVPFGAPARARAPTRTPWPSSSPRDASAHRAVHRRHDRVAATR